MRNFKLYTIYLILSLLTIPGKVLANVDGYFYDISLTSNNISHEIEVNDIDSNGNINQGGNSTPLYSHNTEDDNTGISARIGRKFTNIITRNFFIAPSVSYEFIDNDSQDSNGFKYKIKDRYVAEISFGFDLNPRFSAYLNAGIADVGYEFNATGNSTYITTRDSSPLPGLTSVNLGSYSNRKTSAIFGIGAKYRINRNTYITTEYSQQEVDLASKHSGFINGGVTFVDDTVEIKTIRIGISRNL